MKTAFLGLLRSEGWQIITDVSVQFIGHIFKGQESKIKGNKPYFFILNT
jgi:hypothetical protein